MQNDEIQQAAVGERIRQARRAQHLTMEKLAEAADTSTQFLSRVEQGVQSMTMVKFGRLARALGVSADYLLFGHGEAVDRAALAAEFLAHMNPIERDMAAQMTVAFQNYLNALRPESNV